MHNTDQTLQLLWYLYSTYIQWWRNTHYTETTLVNFTLPPNKNIWNWKLSSRKNNTVSLNKYKINLRYILSVFFFICCCKNRTISYIKVSDFYTIYQWSNVLINLVNLFLFKIMSIRFLSLISHYHSLNEKTKHSDNYRK